MSKTFRNTNAALKKIEKENRPTDRERKAGDVLRAANSMNNGILDESPTTLEETSNKRCIAGNSKVED